MTIKGHSRFPYHVQEERIQTPYVPWQTAPWSVLQGTPVSLPYSNLHGMSRPYEWVHDPQRGVQMTQELAQYCLIMLVWACEAPATGGDTDMKPVPTPVQPQMR